MTAKIPPKIKLKSTAPFPSLNPTSHFSQRLSQNQNSLAGQISLLIGMLISTFLFFFAFVIHTGVLVNAKINLQNAADLAAYAGAAVQARQLNQISFLNYEMRRQFKKFLFRIHVLGQMGYPQFPTSGGDPGPMVGPAFNNGTPRRDPVTCVIFNPNENYCQVAANAGALPSINLPPVVGGGFDPISSSLNEQLRNLEAIRQGGCVAIGQTNLLLNFAWLYNADPNLTQFPNSGNLTSDQIQTFSILKPMIEGLGIVPQEILLKYRIQTLVNYVNTSPQTGLTLARASQLMQEKDAAGLERAAQAFYSAYYTLGNHTFNDPTAILMDELLPASSSQANLLKLQELKQSFETYALDLQIGANNVISTSQQACTASRVTLGTGPFTVGFSKDPSSLTYYAVRLRAKAHLLFSPLGDITLQAYSAAMPFGSRIGPKDNTTVASFGYPVDGAGNSNLFPSLGMAIGEAPSADSSWQLKTVIYELFQALQVGPPTGSGFVNVTADGLKAGYLAAMRPNPNEAGYYNILSDDGLQDPFIRNFGSDRFAALWAPLATDLQLPQIAQSIKQEVNDIFLSPSQTQHLSADGSGSTRIRDELLANLMSYIEQNLRANQGVDSEGINVARLKDPFVNPAPTGDLAQYFAPDAFSTRTSWNVNDEKFGPVRRNGYSVKFVSFKYLKQGFAADAASTFNNFNDLLQSDDQLKADLLQLQH